MSAEILARWQFGITTVYHFFFVPLTIALSMIVAIFQTMWVRTGLEKWLRLTKFYGKLLLINFAMGVVTGIVQEFQFGMNWSEYSRFVGDIFGAPLALEALLAFFLESTFIGVWIFGWDRLNKKVHLASIWLAAIGTLVSSIFILAANSWMQNPVGATYDKASGRAVLHNLGEVFANPVFLATFPHTIASAWMVGCGFVAGIAGWHLARLRREEAVATTTVAPATKTTVVTNDADADETVVEQTATSRRGALAGAHPAREAISAAERDENERSAWRTALKFGAIGLLISGLLVMITGDFQGKVMTKYQPMKMAAAEALYETSPEGQGAPFSVFTIGSLDGKKEIFAVKIPNLLSFLAEGNLTAEVKGINELNETYTRQLAQGADLSNMPYSELVKTYRDADPQRFQQQYEGRTHFNPNIPVTYWAFRLMIGFGLLAMAIGAWMLLAMRGKDPKNTGLWRAAMWAAPLLPLIAISFGWIFTEMGRQPWIVFGALPTMAAVSPTVTAGEVLFSMILYTLLYGAGAVVELGLMKKYVHKGLPEAHPVEVVQDEDAPLSFAY